MLTCAEWLLPLWQEPMNILQVLFKDFAVCVQKYVMLAVLNARNILTSIASVVLRHAAGAQMNAVKWLLKSNGAGSFLSQPYFFGNSQLKYRFRPPIFKLTTKWTIKWKKEHT